MERTLENTPGRGARLPLHLALTCALWLFGALTTPALADVSLRWQDAGSEVDQHALNVLADSKVLADFITMVNENFTLEPPLVLAMGAADGPSIDVDTRVLNLPHDYLTRAIVTQSELVEDRDLALDRALDVVEYTLYHLFGHALAGSADVEADADAEALASWLMIAYWPNGGEQWFKDVSAFADASQKLDGPLSDFWHEHALYRLRQKTLECWVLGRDPVAYERLLSATPDTEARQRRCRSSWLALEQDSRRQLDAVLKETAPLRLNQAIK